jgi:hypothetical protein
MGTVEHDCRQLPALPVVAGMDAVLVHRHGDAALIRPDAGEVPSQRQRARHIGRAAMAEAGIEPRIGVRWHGRQRRQRRIVTALARQQRQLDPSRPA